MIGSRSVQGSSHVYRSKGFPTNTPSSARCRRTNTQPLGHQTHILALCPRAERAVSFCGANMREVGTLFVQPKLAVAPLLLVKCRYRRDGSCQAPGLKSDTNSESGQAKNAEGFHGNLVMDEVVFKLNIRYHHILMSCSRTCPKNSQPRRAGSQGQSIAKKEL